MQEESAGGQILRFLFIVCLSLIAARAQTGNQQKFTVSGNVVSAVGSEAVRGALVELNGADRKSAMTDADGHFEINGVTAGVAFISARRPGFEQQYQPQKRISVGANTDSITLKLMPLSKISGRVVDREGEPIEGVRVQSISEQIVNGRKRWQPGRSANTDESGTFFLEDLTSGNYILRTMEKQLYAVRPKSEAARYVYPATYYPESPTREAAQRVELAPGADMRVDMTLQSVRGVRVSFTTVPPSNSVIARIGPDDRSFSGINAAIDKSGMFTFSAVPPGSWKIVAQGPFNAERQEGEPPMYGELPVDVGVTDIENLKLPLGKLADIEVLVSGVPNAQVQVMLNSPNGAIGAGLSANQNSVQEMRGVLPGTYRVSLPFNGGDNCITSIMSGAQDLRHDDLVVPAGGTAPPIQIVESKNCAQLSIGTNAQANSTVIVTGNSKEFEPQIFNVVASGYTATGLSEGDYQVYAFDNASDLEYANPEVMRGFKSQSVHLDAGQKASVQLEVNERQPK